MLTDIALIILAALLGNLLFSRIGLPGILGMVAAGMLLGPSGLDQIDPPVIDLLQEFKTVALIVILIRAGLGISKDTLNRIGGPAVRMGFIPCIFEGTVVALAASYLLGLEPLAAGMLGFIVAAVSPAVVVPGMIELKDSGYGRRKEVPTIVLAGASLDDVIAITVFGVFAGVAAGGSVDLGYLLIGVPAGIVLGGLIGAAIGWLLVQLFRHSDIDDVRKVILFVIVAVIFYETSELPAVKDVVPIASLLGIMAIGFVILEKADGVAKRLARQFQKVWILAEILLFVYIGSEVRLEELNASVVAIGLALLAVGLTARSLGVWVSLIGSGLDAREQMFCVVAYWPKATVQAAIGAVPLAMILDGSISSISPASGQTILAIAVLSIVVTAPLGAIGIKAFGPRLLARD